MSEYHEWNSFENTYMEDSFVLDIQESDTQLSLTVEIVLTEEHPLYKPPTETEKYCYRAGNIVFNDLVSVRWLARRMQPITDADDRIDYGNIDIFEQTSDGYHLVGDWGEIVVSSSPPVIEWSTWIFD